MKLIALILISIFIVIFAIQNSSIVTLSLFNKSFQVSLALLIILCYFFGVVSGLLYIIPSVIRKNLTISDLKGRLNTQEKKEINKIKNT